MKAFPKIVQWQLQKTLAVSALPHPDTDRLTAFLEQSLPRAERKSVLEHLAQCSECRQITALAEAPVPLQAVKLRSAHSWRPVLAWSGMAAGVLVVGTLLFLGRANQRKYVTGAVREQPVLTAQNSSESGSPAVIHARTVEKMDERGIKAEPRANELKPSLKQGTTNGAIQKKTANILQNPDAAPDMTRDSLQAVQDVAAAKTGKDASMNTASQQLMAGRMSARRQTAPTSENHGAALENNMRESFAPSVPNTSAPTTNANDRYPRWTLNSDGTLLRSLDTGASWQKISIPGNAALLHSIATVGTDVWVGGASGALYHSADEGGHWTQVSPAISGQLLSDDVISIEFATAQRGEFVTSKQEVWTTADGGQNWSRK